MNKIPNPFAGMASEVLSKFNETAQQMKEASKSKYGFVQKPGFNYAFLTPKRLAELLHVSIKTLERMRKDGSGPPFKKIGKKHIRYSVVELDAWWEAKHANSN